MSTVAILGTINLDVIVSPGGRTTESLGGILYNTLPLAALLEGTGWRVRPVARLGAADRDRAATLLGRFPAADASGLIVDPGGTNRCRLDYTRAADRWEEVDLRVAPLDANDLVGVATANAVLVNMISGRDLARTAVESLRASSRGLFLLDIQALARTSDSPRRPHPVDDWERWCRAFHVVRGNEEEVRWFTGGPHEVSAAIERTLRAGAEEVLVTRGRRGSLRGILEVGDVVRVDEVPSYPAPAGSGDPTGCGDAYLAGICAGRLLGLSPFEAVHLGSWTAAQVAGILGIEAMTALRGLRERAAQAVPAFARLVSDPALPPAAPGAGPSR